MTTSSIHNPDRYMADLRQVLSQGRKRIGLLIGAGAPTAIRIDSSTQLVADDGDPLIPDIAGLTSAVFSDLTEDDRTVIDHLIHDIDGIINVETILTRVRQLAQVIGKSTIHCLDARSYENLGRRICQAIGRHVSRNLPTGSNPYTELVAWICGTRRVHSVEIFTPNYDLLFEQAFERARVPYFDGFTGSHLPFFDPASVSSDDLPSRWSKLWKLHGSLGWNVVDGQVVRLGDSEATELIYPDHLKYDRVTRLPYSALFERLRQFLTTPDTLLLCSGFSFLDSHICAVLDESLAANNHTAVVAFQYCSLNDEGPAIQLALSRPNMSVYARDGAVINGVRGHWRPGEPEHHDWLDIRRTFWHSESDTIAGQFLLGDFAMLAQFLALIQARQIESPMSEDDDLLTSPDNPTDSSIQVQTNA